VTLYVQESFLGFLVIPTVNRVRGVLEYAEENGSKGSCAEQPLKEIHSKFLLKRLFLKGSSLMPHDVFKAQPPCLAHHPAPPAPFSSLHLSKSWQE